MLKNVHSEKLINHQFL